MKNNNNNNNAVRIAKLALPYNNERTGYKKETILHVKGTRYTHAICSIREGEEGRQTFGGPMVPGPWASTFGLATIMTSHDRSDEMQNENNRTITVETGDLLSIDGNIFEVEIVRNEYVHLTLFK